MKGTRVSISNVRWSGVRVANGDGIRLLVCRRAEDRVSRVETMVGYSLWHCAVGRRKSGHVVEMCCAVRSCDKEADARDRLLMKRINQEADEGEKRWQSRARVQTEGITQDRQQQNSCGDRHTKKELGLVQQWFTGLAGCRSCKAEGRQASVNIND